MLTHRRKRGAALIMALLVAALMYVLGVSLSSIVTREYQVTGNSDLQAKALYIAEAGAQYALEYIDSQVWATWHYQESKAAQYQVQGKSSANPSGTELCWTGVSGANPADLPSKNGQRVTRLLSMRTATPPNQPYLFQRSLPLPGYIAIFTTDFDTVKQPNPYNPNKPAADALAFVDGHYVKFNADAKAYVNQYNGYIVQWNAYVDQYNKAVDATNVVWQKFTDQVNTYKNDPTHPEYKEDPTLLNAPTEPAYAKLPTATAIVRAPQLPLRTYYIYTVSMVVTGAVYGSNAGIGGSAGKDLALASKKVTVDVLVNTYPFQVQMVPRAYPPQLPAGITWPPTDPKPATPGSVTAKTDADTGATTFDITPPDWKDGLPANGALTPPKWVTPDFKITYDAIVDDPTGARYEQDVAQRETTPAYLKNQGDFTLSRLNETQR